MRFAPTVVQGVIRVGWEPSVDDRGAFARLHCPDEFAQAGAPFIPLQTSLSRNTAAGTLRGLHFQMAPRAEAKLVRVTRGRVFDVAVDLRPQSPTYLKWIGETLSADNGVALLIPEGVAHGFLTLEPETDVLYQINRMFEPGYDQGYRWNDPAFGIKWPATPAVISARDAGYADFKA